MLAIGGIGTSTMMPRTSGRGPAAPREPDAPASESRALVPVAAPTPGNRSATRRPLAAFLAHLIATKTQAPQTRTRRRAEPEDVTGIYLAATKPRVVTRNKFDGQA